MTASVLVGEADDIRYATERNTPEKALRRTILDWVEELLDGWRSGRNRLVTLIFPG